MVVQSGFHTEHLQNTDFFACGAHKYVFGEQQQLFKHNWKSSPCSVGFYAELSYVKHNIVSDFPEKHPILDYIYARLHIC